MPYTALDDRDLVQAAQDGDARALNELLARHLDRIAAICSRIVGATGDADDATQNAMISIVRALDRFDGRSTFSTWAYRIATNASIDEVRRRRRRPQLHILPADDGPTAEDADPLSHRLVEGVLDRMMVYAALDTLPDSFRTAVVLCDIAELDYQEISQLLGVPVGTAKSRVARGRHMLVKKLGNRPDAIDVKRTPEPET